MPIEAKPAGLRVPEGISKLLRDLIHERTGLFFEDERMNDLLDKLTPVAQNRGYRSFLEYYYVLRDNQQGEWERAWEALSVQETYFWREISQVEALTEIIIPHWFRKHSQPFRIWSAACATGEEPFTLAIAALEAGLGEYPIEIVGSDASRAALAKAEAAIYRDKAFRTLPPHLRGKYFEPVAGGWKLATEVIRRVKFKRVNLLESGEVAPMAYVQAIFCRNVFIYFSAHAIRQTVAMMAAKIPPGGYLFVGASESLLRMTTDFELVQIGSALAYVRI